VVELPGVSGRLRTRGDVGGEELPGTLEALVGWVGLSTDIEARNASPCRLVLLLI
jgi:hypothetical protein